MHLYVVAMEANRSATIVIFIWLRSIWQIFAFFREALDITCNYAAKRAKTGVRNGGRFHLRGWPFTNPTVSQLFDFTRVMLYYYILYYTILYYTILYSTVEI